MEPVLTPGERASPLWAKVRKYLEQRLAVTRARLDHDMPEQKTARLRGAIAELKHLISLGDEKPVVSDEDERFKD